MGDELRCCDEHARTTDRDAALGCLDVEGLDVLVGALEAGGQAAYAAVIRTTDLSPELRSAFKRGYDTAVDAVRHVAAAQRQLREQAAAERAKLQYPTGRPGWLGRGQLWPCGSCGKSVDDEDPHRCEPPSTTPTDPGGAPGTRVNVTAHEGQDA